MGRPLRTEGLEQISSEKLTYTQAVCFLVGTLFFLVGSSLAVYVASRELKKREQPAAAEPLI